MRERVAVREPNAESRYRARPPVGAQGSPNDFLSITFSGTGMLAVAG
jgi:hypothetical protein